MHVKIKHINTNMQGWIRSAGLPVYTYIHICICVYMHATITHMNTNMQGWIRSAGLPSYAEIREMSHWYIYMYIHI